MAGGKHAGTPANESERAQDLAESFDVQFAISTARAETKRENGTYPYDLDGIVTSQDGSST